MMKKLLFGIENVKKIYKMGEVSVPALRGISLKVERGEFIAITGPSGSGKSTLMHILGCLDKPTEGIFYFDGKNILEASEDNLAEIRNQKIGFVFQQFNLLSGMNALENVETPCINPCKSYYLIIVPFVCPINKIGLEEERFFHHPNRLSGGQRQKVAIARALINNPTLLLADEPTGSLDTVSGDEIIKIFQNLNKEGKTIILVTHESYIAHYAKRIIHLKDGLIQEDKINNAL